MSHFVCGEQRAAHNQQHARSIVLDNQCATRHRRHTQDATYDRGRSIQQTHAEPTTRSRKCNARDERKPDARAPRGCACVGITARTGLRAFRSGCLNSGSMALGDASDVAARRLHISFACAHRWPTDVDRLRCGLRTRLGAREVRTVGSCCTPRPRLPASRDPMKPPALSTISPHSELKFRVLRRCFQCAATRVASCPCHACRRRATPRQARPA